ncbi:MAG: hypothetical protein ACTSSG_09880 [Candidatus Heimdallarchaeaceae archaeon]
MKKKSKIVTILFLLFLVTNIFSNFAYQDSSTTVNSEERKGIIIKTLTQNKKERGFSSEDLFDHQKTVFPPSTHSNEEIETVSTPDTIYPISTNLTVYKKEENISPTQKLSLSNPSDGDTFYRGDTITVTGKLWSGIPGDYWEGETVKLFYNVTKSQYENNTVFYEGNPQYYVGSDTTDSNGDFSISLKTSTLTANPFSRVGVINLLTWFDGNPSKGRGVGSPGGANVTFYGQLLIDVSYSVTNPGAGYTFTTQVIFDNTTQIVTNGTSYKLKIEWSTSGIHTETNYTFDATNTDTYFNTAPASVETVTYDSWYDFSSLSLNYFVKANASDPVTATTTLHKRVVDQTELQVVADAYFVVGSSLINTPIEIPLNGYFTIYANLSSETGAESSKTIRISYKKGTSVMFTEDRVTNSSGEIQFNKLFDYTWFSDIRESFSLEFTALSSEFPGSTITPDSLNANLAVNITSIGIHITNNAIFYTNGMSINYEVFLVDEFGRNVTGTNFQLDFPGIASQQRTTTSTVLSIDTTIPNYSGVEQTDTKTILVTALNVTGTSYRFQVLGSVTNTDTFNMYYALILTLVDFNNDVILDGNTTSIFNSTFWNSLDSGSYNLSATDQSGRIPIGVVISLTLSGPGGINEQVTQTISDSSTSWVLFAKSDFLADLNTYEAYTGLTLTATGGLYTPATTIIQTVNIYGPDNTYPIITNIIRTPNPDNLGAHEPYFNITFNVFASDVGTGIRYVAIYYAFYYDENLLNPYHSIPQIIFLTDVGGGNYQGEIVANVTHSQLYVAYFIEVVDYAGHGLDEFGNKQTNPSLYYDANFGWVNQTEIYIYQLGDYIPPREVQVPSVTSSPDPLNPYINITIYVNDTIVWSGMSYVELYVNRTNTETSVLEVNFLIVNMTNVPGTNQWTYLLLMEYNYEYTWYYIAYDNATPKHNAYDSSSTAIHFASAVDNIGPNLSGLSHTFPGSILYSNLTITFSVTVSDDIVGVAEVILQIEYLENEYNISMVQQGNTTLYSASFNLTKYEISGYGTFPLVYRVLATDNVGNVRISAPVTLSVVKERARVLPSGLTGNIGAIVGGAVGGVIALIAVLFLWFNRHTLQTYAKKQTFRRRLRDYLREIIEEIKKDGLEGRYKEGLLKTWNVVEGIGREFFSLPRYKSQTPMEFSRLLARKGKIDLKLMYTLLEYFTKARYGYEEITEDDFNAGVRALLKIIDKIEVGEMKIES